MYTFSFIVGNIIPKSVKHSATKFEACFKALGSRGWLKFSNSPIVDISSYWWGFEGAYGFEG